MNFIHLYLSPTPPFDFAAAAYSHGWARLAPNSWDEATRVLSRVERLDAGQVVDLRLTGTGDAHHPRVTIEVSHADPLSAADRAEIERKIGHMLRVDEDFSDFYAQCAARGGRWAAIGGGLGRLLRSPTVFEDVVKTIATTNTHWIDYFNGRISAETDFLHQAIQSQHVYVGDLVLTEVLQGFRLDKEFDKAREALGKLPVLTLVGPENAILAAHNYRLLRKCGITIRSTIDCLIATYCITNEVPLLHSGRDFAPFAEQLGLIILLPKAN